MHFKSTEPNPLFPQVIDVEPSEIAEKINSICLVDVRIAIEYDAELGHIPEAMLIPLNILPEHMENLPKDIPIVFVCRTGRRSAKAAAYFQEWGYKNVYNLKGGMVLWREVNH